MDVELEQCLGRWTGNTPPTTPPPRSLPLFNNHPTLQPWYRMRLQSNCRRIRFQQHLLPSRAICIRADGYRQQAHALNTLLGQAQTEADECRRAERENVMQDDMLSRLGSGESSQHVQSIGTCGPQQYFMLLQPPHCSFPAITLLIFPLLAIAYKKFAIIPPFL